MLAISPTPTRADYARLQSEAQGLRDTLNAFWRSRLANKLYHLVA